MPDWLIRLIESILIFLGGAFGLKLLDKYYLHKDKKLVTVSRKDTQLMDRMGEWSDKLQTRVDVLEKEVSDLHTKHTECLKREAANQARVAILEAWKIRYDGEQHGHQQDGAARRG